MNFLRNLFNWLFEFDSPTVSSSWIRDCERRQWSVGKEDQVCWRWPVRKQ